MSAATGPNGRGYPISLAREARELSAGGWTDSDIPRIFARRGINVSRRTVQRWTSEKLAESDLRARNRRYWQRKLREQGVRLGADSATPEYRMARAVALHEQARLSAADVARAMSYDFPDQPVTEHQMWRALHVTGRWPARSLNTGREAA